MVHRPFLCTVAFIVMMGCNSVKQMPSATIPNSSAALKLLPADRWHPDQRSHITTYPTSALKAGVQGDVVMLLDINEKGCVIKLKLISGPPQLVPSVEKFVQKIQFNPEPSDFPGPWQYSITARFDIKGFTGVSPTGHDIQLVKVPLPPSSPQPNFSK